MPLFLWSWEIDSIYVWSQSCRQPGISLTVLAIRRNSLLPVERHFSSAASSSLSQKGRLTGWFLLLFYPKTREMNFSHLSGSLKWQLSFFMLRKHWHCLLWFPPEMFSCSPLPFIQLIISHNCVNKKFCAFSDEKRKIT